MWSTSTIAFPCQSSVVGDSEPAYGTLSEGRPRGRFQLKFLGAPDERTEKLQGRRSHWPLQILILVAVSTLRFSTAYADLEDTQVLIQLRNPTFDNVVFSFEVDVVAGDADSVTFPGQNATTINVDADFIRVDLGCDFSACHYKCHGLSADARRRK
jgi:hypothetical protein